MITPNASSAPLHAPNPNKLTVPTNEIMRMITARELLRTTLNRILPKSVGIFYACENRSKAGIS